MKALAGVVGGLFFGFFVAQTVRFLFISVPALDGLSGLVFFAVWGLGVYLAIKSPTPTKAWRKLLIYAGIAGLVLPVVAIASRSFMESRIASNMPGPADSNNAAQSFTNGVASGFVPSAASGIAVAFFSAIGLVLGAIFLLVGLLLGRRNTVAGEDGA